MNKQLSALFLFCLLALAGPAQALDLDELIAVTAMPLAVADVVALPGVPQTEVVTVVTTLNDAAVPAPQFVEIVRYAPVALVQPAEPRFVTYVTQEYERGVVGEPLALSIADRYKTYGFEEVHIADPPVMTYVERREILPEVVVTRFQPVEFDPLALVAMPLAVAAVADIAGVPANDLMRFVASLNDAMVPAPQFVEVVRYSPVVLVDRTASPQFIEFVSTEVDRGVIGRPLAFSIAERIEAFQPVEIDVIEPRPMLLVERDELLPAVVATRAHPHGGPPGQLKKQLGLQTGADVVHGAVPKRVARTRPAKARSVEVRGDDDRRERKQRVTRERRVPRTRAIRGDDDGGRQPKRRIRQERQVAPPVVKERGGNRGGGGGKSHGNSGGGKGGGKGKGKGKGKG